MLGGINFELYIAERDCKVVLIAYGYDGPQIELNLPLPYNRESQSMAFCGISETWDKLSFGFQIAEKQIERVVIEVTIKIQKIHWYYGGLDDSIPHPVITQKRLVISIDEADRPILIPETC